MTLRDFLGNLSAELQGLAARALEIEERVGDVIAGRMHGGDRLMVSLQGLDHLVQTGNELSAFLRALSASVDAEMTVPVAAHIQSIGLRSLADGLVGNMTPAMGRSAPAGEVDLF